MDSRWGGVEEVGRGSPPSVRWGGNPLTSRFRVALSARSAYRLTMRRFLVGLCLLGGCSSVEEVEPLAPLIPFRVGAEWTYSVADSGLHPTLKDSVMTVHVMQESGGWFRIDATDAP